MFFLWALTSVLALAHLDSGAADKARDPIAVPESKSANPSESEPQLEAPAESPARPDWVSAAPQTVGDVYYVTVDSGPFASEAEARQKLDDALVARTENHVNEYLGYDDAARYFSFSADQIRAELVPAASTFTETRPYSFGEMYHAYARLAFDSSFHDRLRHEWRELQSWFRLARFGAFGLLGTAALATLFTWLRLDTFTRGLHTFSLRLGAAATILGLIAAGYVAVQRIPAL